MRILRRERKNAWGRRAFAVVAAMALAGGVAACGGDDDGGGGDGESRNIYLNAYAQEIPYFQDWHAGAAARAEELGWQVSSEFGNTTPEQQVQQLENALAQQPDGIMVTPIDEESLVPVLTRAKEQGVSVIAFGADVASAAAKDSFVARENYDLGVEKSEFVIDALGGQGKVGIVHGIRGLTFTEEQADAYQDVLGEESGITVVDGPYTGGFSADLGLNATQNLLTANPNLDAIIYDNDDLALGGAEGAQNRGISPDEIVVVGTDGGEAALDAVANGTLDMTISLCGYREGIEGINTLDTLFEEGEGEERVVTETETFTTENIDDQRAELDQREECN